MTDRFTSQYKMLDEVRKTIQAAVFDEDTQPRDLTSLSKRLQETCRDILTLRERAKAEGSEVGKFTADDHLNLLKRIQRRVSTAVHAPKTAPRDLAALTRRLQDISSEIATLEERAEMEGQQVGSTNSRKAKDARRGAFDPESV